ncbi:hypothetical protein JD844_019918 [Phrynosoma platyrhinos]|uniref:Cytochrome P450 2W1 n=1 Tax=Phrynosoma platyrhinos TaxID=52577 RepID=A0ABQ7TR97_PHRPL|nr:hypothetical protein JD844_019918 [Phrynosoma platyrhinos]
MAWLIFFLSYPVPICLLCTLIILASLFLPTSSRKAAFTMPPGPTPLPIIGNLHLLDIKRQDKSILKLAKKYGPVFTLHFGFQKVVVLTGYEAVKDALVNFTEEFVDRPLIPIFEQIQHGHGVFFSTGELWRATRRFTMSSMRNLGVGRTLIEERILEELSFLVEDIKAFKGEPFSLRTFNRAPTNITFVLLFGEREICFEVGLGYNQEHQKVGHAHVGLQKETFPGSGHRGTMVIPSLTSVLLDKSHWETPDEFNPNHFLDAEGKFVKKEAFVPFSLGRRNCMGESLAKMELFLFFAGLLQKFTFQPPPGLTERDLDLTVPQTTFTLRPQPQLTCAVPHD